MVQPALRVALTAAFALVGCAANASPAGVLHGHGRIVHIGPGVRLDRALGIPRSCPGLDVALYCNVGAVQLHEPASARFDRTDGITATGAIKGAAQAVGSVLVRGRRVVLRGRDRGGALYVRGVSAYTFVAARFRGLGLASGGVDTITMRCERGHPLAVLERPDGQLLRPELELLADVPHDPQFRGPDACR